MLCYGTIERKDCAPCHSVVNMFSKVAILTSVLDLKHCKLYKIGQKNLATKDNDFVSYCYTLLNELYEKKKMESENHT